MAWSSGYDSGVVTSVAIHPVRNGVFSVIIGGFGLLFLLAGMKDPDPRSTIAGLVVGFALIFVAVWLMRVCVRQTVRVVKAYFR